MIKSVVPCLLLAGRRGVEPCEPVGTGEWRPVCGPFVIDAVSLSAVALVKILSRRDDASVRRRFDEWAAGMDLPIARMKEIRAFARALADENRIHDTASKTEMKKKTKKKEL